MDNAKLNLQLRKGTGSREANRLRKASHIPTIIYGKRAESRPALVNARELRQFLSKYGRNTVFSTELAEEHDFSMFIKDVQYHPVTKDIIHVDLQRVSLNEKIQTEVPVKTIGSEAIARDGNVVVHQLNHVTVECLPQDVPRYIEADVSGMTQGNSLTAGQLILPPGVSLVTDPNAVILSVTGGKMDLEVEKEDEPVTPEEKEPDVHDKPQ